MDSAVVKNAVGALDKLLSQTKRALWEVEREVYGDPGYGNDQGGWEYPRFALAGHLEELQTSCWSSSTQPKCPRRGTRSSKAWIGVTAAKDGLRHTDDDDEGQNCQSPALTFVERLINAMRMTVMAAILSKEAWTLAKLEAMLEDTPGLIHRRQALGNEADLQETMHSVVARCVMVSDKVTARIEQWPIDRLIFYARNPRKNDGAVDRMCGSIREFGFKIPVLARSDGEVDGHLRLKAARKLGISEIPVILCDEWIESARCAKRLPASSRVAAATAREVGILAPPDLSTPGCP